MKNSDKFRVWIIENKNFEIELTNLKNQDKTTLFVANNIGLAEQYAKNVARVLECEMWEM